MSGSSNNFEITTAQRMVSATWGSVLTSLLVTPLDVVRVRLQSQNPPTPINLSRFPAYSTSFKQLPPDLGVNSCCREVFWVGNNGQFCLAGNGTTQIAGAAATECAVEETQRKTFNSTMDGLKKIARNEGYLTLWRGLSPTLAMAIPANVIYFTGYDWLRYNQASPLTKITNDVYVPLIAGSIARVAAAIVVSPVEMFRTRMQAASGGTTGVFKDTLLGLHRMTQTQGYTSLWRGLTLTMWRDVPFSGIYWWGYEAMRNRLTDSREAASGHELDSQRSMTGGRQSQAHESQMTTFVDSFLAGAGSGAIAAFVTTPFDVGKTRQQVYHHAGDDAPSVVAAKEFTKQGKPIPEELSMPRFIYHIFREEGMAGLFRGWAARCLKIAPACAIMISSYEVGKKWARKVNEQKENKKTTA
ncbi:Carrier protein, mitochondrial [Exophiala xenobiotica]|uniref:Carrier protein, mitochondrial n=1 Tax=Vermiconidia calcicola TaxID=1690605 RepID=A0AAV9QJV6_9PEZI|nr:Carrier protein, mitochondrial [Exophiala xenobiotica]KAK5539422.1 Carrier protein, mitochondrial [Chaetothyriales sp. CCFEE 6169]KAK5543492.1 Carrier protein, mitochondrial [Vermiconidia calcicola]KAK5223439.1 Carrier protein, mitochondrial [Exophiala xenobiotica]KAK5258290.1 Carrier protein, mitochondrial [Exophiala xenobiotica]